VLLRAELSAVGGIWRRLLAPPIARTPEASSDARDQSMWSSVPSSLSSTLCSRSQTPAACQSRSRRQHVITHPQPISCGRYPRESPS
jgi:general L-amino acid transport system substrate-binding protein